MITQEEARARVQRGAAHLDRVRPGWQDRIDIGTLTLSDPCGCIVGQLVPGTTWGSRFCRGVNVLGMNDGYDGATFGVCLRFEEHDGKNEVCYAPLQNAWIEAICDRRLPLVETPNGQHHEIEV